MMSDIERRFAELVDTREPFSSDDVTANGSVALDGSHAPNAGQSGIGSMFQAAAKAKRIEFTGEVVRSKAPHRKGGVIRVWVGTEVGQLWARRLLDPGR